MLKTAAYQGVFPHSVCEVSTLKGSTSDDSVHQLDTPVDTQTTCANDDKLPHLHSCRGVLLHPKALRWTNELLLLSFHTTSGIKRMHSLYVVIPPYTMSITYQTQKHGVSIILLLRLITIQHVEVHRQLQAHVCV